MENKYRFLTEPEFRKLYGDNWRYTVRHSFTEEMDSLLGEPLLREIKGEEDFPFRYRGWNISSEMVVKINEGEYEKLLENIAGQKSVESNLSLIREIDNRLMYTLKLNGTSSSFVIFKSPTENCQTASIASFANLLNTQKDETILNVLRIVSERIDKRLFIIDVRKEVIRDRLLNNIVILQDYESTNGSLMSLGLLKL